MVARTVDEEQLRSMEGRIRIGKVPFLNTLPIYAPMQLGMMPCSGVLVEGSPTRLTELMLAGLVDIAPLPLAAWARHPDKLVPLGGPCIAADGPARSVLLFSGEAPQERRWIKVAVPSDSATSVVLLRLLAKQFWGDRVRLDTVVMPPKLAPMLNAAHSALLIGDSALVAARANPELHATDLAQAWKERSGLPMVFAIMVARKELAADESLWAVHRELVESTEEGLAMLPKLAARASAMGKYLDEASALTYLQGLRYELGAHELEGARRFLRDAQALGGFATSELEPLQDPNLATALSGDDVPNRQVGQ